VIENKGAEEVASGEWPLEAGGKRVARKEATGKIEGLPASVESRNHDP
jgi:hypothetical protein